MSCSVIQCGCLINFTTGVLPKSTTSTTNDDVFERTFRFKKESFDKNILTISYKKINSTTEPIIGLDLS